MVDTSTGDYPCRWQAVHVAAELATHADDIGVPIRLDQTSGFSAGLRALLSMMP